MISSEYTVLLFSVLSKELNFGWILSAFSKPAKVFSYWKMVFFFCYLYFLSNGSNCFKVSSFLHVFMLSSGFLTKKKHVKKVSFLWWKWIFPTRAQEKMIYYSKIGGGKHPIKTKPPHLGKLKSMNMITIFLSSFLFFLLFSSPQNARNQSLETLHQTCL